MIGVRLQEPQLIVLDAWINRQPERTTRPEAIRRLIEAGLKAEAAS